MPSAGRERPSVERATLRAFVASSTVDEDHLLLDEPTWDDLDLDAVAERLGRTVSLQVEASYTQEQYDIVLM